MPLFPRPSGGEPGLALLPELELPEPRWRQLVLPPARQPALSAALEIMVVAPHLHQPDVGLPLAEPRLLQVVARLALVVFANLAVQPDLILDNAVLSG